MGVSDFATGDYIVIQHAGVKTRVQAGSIAATPGCIGRSCSTAGSVLYSYRWQQVLGFEDGSVTPPSPLVNVKQAAQFPPSQYVNSQQGVFTRVCVSPTNSGNTLSEGLIFKSTNDGPFLPLTIIYVGRKRVCINDSGAGWIAQYPHLTPSDLDIAVSNPTVGTANDIYAKVTRVVGNTIVFASRGQIQPFQESMAALPTVAFPSIPSQSGEFKVFHDATPALFQLGEDLRAHPRSEPVEVHVPTGDYNVYPGNARSAPAVLELLGLSNVSIGGDGTNKTIFHLRGWRTAPGQSFFSYLVQNGVHPPLNIAGVGTNVGPGRLSALREYALCDPAMSGKNQVRLADPTSAINFDKLFAAGTIVAVGEDCSSKRAVCHGVYPAGLNFEFNKVDASNASTGIVTLQTPLLKSYSNLRANVELRGPGQYPYGDGFVGAPVILSDRDCSGGVANQCGLVSSRNINFHDFSVIGNGTSFAFNSNYQSALVNVLADTSFGPIYGADAYPTISHSNITQEDPGDEQGPITAAVSTEHMRVFDNHIQSVGIVGQTCEEGSVDFKIFGNIYLHTGYGPSSGGSGNEGLITGGYCAGMDFTNNTVKVYHSALQGIFAGPFTGRVEKNAFYTDSMIEGAVGKRTGPTLGAWDASNRGPMPLHTFRNNTETIGPDRGSAKP